MATRLYSLKKLSTVSHQKPFLVGSFFLRVDKMNMVKNTGNLPWLGSSVG